MTSGHKLLPTTVSPGVAAFLACVDDVKVMQRFPTAATALEKGRLTLILGKMYLDGDEACRREILMHEATHFYMATLERWPDRPDKSRWNAMTQEEQLRAQEDAMLWNLVTDACIHYHGGCHQHDPEGQFITWESLGLAPMPAELAYEILKQRRDESGQSPDGEGCGSCQYSTSDDDPASFLKGLEASGKMAQHDEFANAGRPSNGAGTGRGEGAYVEASPPPKWIRETLDYLIAKRGDERRRSWRRENRCHRDLPGRSATNGYGGLFLIDASGSISDEDLAMFLGAVMATPELKSSRCVIFDTECSPVVPVSQAQAALRAHGRGGTSFGPPAALRTLGEPVVWLTDGYPCDHWPEAHTDTELWCITTDVTPPHGIRIQASSGD